MEEIIEIIPDGALPLWTTCTVTDGEPPKSGAAVGLHGGGANHHLGGQPASSGQSLEQLDADPLGRPAHEAIVEGFIRPVVVGR